MAAPLTGGPRHLPSLPSVNAGPGAEDGGTGSPIGVKPHVTFAAQHPACASAATTADMHDEVHVVSLHDEFTKLMEFWYAVLLYAVMPRPAFDNPVTFTAGRLDIDGHVHGQRWTV